MKTTEEVVLEEVLCLLQNEDTKKELLKEIEHTLKEDGIAEKILTEATCLTEKIIAQKNLLKEAIDTIRGEVVLLQLWAKKSREIYLSQILKYRAIVLQDKAEYLEERMNTLAI